MSGIVLTGLAVNDPLPGNYIETLFAQGQVSGFQGARPILLIGNATSAGIGVPDTTLYGPDTPVPAVSENDVINLTGTGSELHLMWNDVSAIVGTAIKIYFIIVTASAGTASSKQMTLLNVPTGAGTVRQYVGDEFVEYSFASGDTLASITAGMVAAVNAKSKWPVTAAQTTSSTSNDSWTLTARIKGPRGNWLRAQASITFGNGGTPNTTLTGTTDAFFTSGATADSSTTALGTIFSTRYYYIASAAEDATQVGALVTQVNTQALPTNGIRQRVFVGSVDTQSNIDTISVAQNAARAEFWWQKNGIIPPSRMAARAAAIVALNENSGTKPRLNFVNFPINDSDAASWRQWPAPRDRTAWPTPVTLRVALSNGVTPIGVRANGSTYLVDRITSRSLNGANADYRIRDAHKVTVIDFFADDYGQKCNDQLGGKNLTDDVPQGSPNQPDGDTTTPSRFRDLGFGLINLYGSRNLLQKTDLTKADSIVQRESANPSRLSASYGLYPVDILKTTATLISQVG